MNGRCLIAFWAAVLLLAFAGRASADGAYQRTDDRKRTLVWNNDPQPGDAAEWTGTRDSEGYAEGEGTLKWFRVQQAFTTGSNLATVRKQTPISSYSGTMVHGKFEGAVTTVDHGKTYHAKFADGQRKGNWSLGPVVAKAGSVESTAEPEESKKTTASKPKITAAEKVGSSAEPKISEAAEPEPPSEGPDEAGAEVTAQPATPKVAAATEGGKSEVSGSTAGTSSNRSTLNSQPSTPLIARASEQADESATPRQQPVTKKSALAPGAVRAMERPERQVEKKSEKPREAKVTKTPKTEVPKAEPTKVVESPAEGPRSAGAEKVQTPTPKSTTESPHPSSFTPPPSVNESPTDDSIRTLTGPPSSLRVKPIPAPPPSEAPVATPSASPAAPKLNSVQAMDIADIEARTKGYDLGEYQLPKAEYNAVDDTWSVAYIGREKDKTAKHLSVIVQDKTGKAEVNR